MSIDADRAEILASLLAHPGWGVLSQHARQEWDTRERAGRHTALNDTDDKRALDKLRQITAAQEAVEWMLHWPSQEIARLKRLSSPATATADTVVQMMSRRGGL